jgi:hypothetical protein
MQSADAPADQMPQLVVVIAVTQHENGEGRGMGASDEDLHGCGSGVRLKVRQGFQERGVGGPVSFTGEEGERGRWRTGPHDICRYRPFAHHGLRPKLALSLEGAVFST